MPVEVRVELILMYAFSICSVQLNDLIGTSSCLSKFGGMDRKCKTYTTGLRNLEDRHAVAVRPLHLDVEFFVSDDEDDVY